MIVEILFVVYMFLWFLTNLPVPGAAQFGWASNWLAFMQFYFWASFFLLRA